MFGKKSPMKGLTLYTSEIVRNKSKKLSETRKKMFQLGELPVLTGTTNPMYGLPSWNSGLTKFDDDRILNCGKKISKIKKIEWSNKSEDEKQIIINRLNDAMIQVRKPTKIEVKIRDFLISKNINFETNHLIDKFRVDFYIPQNNLVIECDGDYWHANPIKYNKTNLDNIQLKNIDRDYRKEKMLNDYKINFIRFWEFDINNNFEKVKNTIWEKLQKK